MAIVQRKSKKLIHFFVNYPSGWVESLSKAMFQFAFCMFTRPGIMGNWREITGDPLGIQLPLDECVLATTWWINWKKIRNIFVLKAGISIYETAREMMLINTNRCGVFLYVFLNWHWGCWQWPCVAVILDFMRTNWLICGAPSPGTTLLYFPMMLKVHTIDGWWILMRTQWDCKTNTLW